jgi:UDP:flavonoid glycosyltransferase YjiC (YdhE family)
MATVLLAWELGGGAGHCVSLAPLASGLIARGHDVWVAARNLATVRRVFGPMKVGYLQAPYLAEQPPNPIRHTVSLAHILHNTGFGDQATLEVFCKAWRNLLESTGPDLAVCDHSPMSLLACRYQNIPCAVLGTGFSVPPTISPWPDLRYWLPSSEQANDLGKAEEVILRRVNEQLTRDKILPLARLADLYPEAGARFLRTFRELDHYPNRGNAEYIGAWSPEGGIEPEWPAGDGPRLFGYLKPPATGWRISELLTFLRETRLSTLLYVPGVNALWRRKFESPRLRFADGPVNIRKVAKQCDFAVFNGTAGSMTAMLLAGVPQLNMPFYLEQVISSRRLADLGAGLVANPRRIEQMAARLMSLVQADRYRQQAKAFAQKYSGFDQQQAIDRTVEALLYLIRSPK